VHYKVWRSNKDKELHLICGEGLAAFNALPAAMRHLGPWAGAHEGEVDRLRLPYRTMLAEQGFAIICAHETKLPLESAKGVHALHPTNTDCATCKGTWPRADASRPQGQGLSAVRWTRVDQGTDRLIVDTIIGQELARGRSS